MQLKILATIFAAALMVMTFNNCEEVGSTKSTSTDPESANALSNGEKAIYVWNSITYERHAVVLFSNRGYFDQAQSLSWSFFHGRNGVCIVRDEPDGDVKDFVNFDCDKPGKLDVVLVALMPPRISGEPYHVERFETTIYLKESVERDELGRTTLITHDDSELFPNGSPIAPSSNTSGGGGYDASGTGSNLDPLFLRGLQVYGERCAVCHMINGDPTGNGDDNDNARRYFRLRRDYYEVLNNGPGGYTNHCNINFGSIQAAPGRTQRQRQAIAAALCRIRIGLASDTFAMYGYPQVVELFDFESQSVHNVDQVDAFSFNANKRIFTQRFEDVENENDARNNDPRNTTVFANENDAENANGGNEAFILTVPDAITVDPGDPGAVPPVPPTLADGFTWGGYDLNSPGDGRGRNLGTNNNDIPPNALEVEVFNFNGNGSLANGTTRYPVITDIYSEPDINGNNEVFRVPRVNFKQDDDTQRDLEALIIYIVETL